MSLQKVDLDVFPDTLTLSFLESGCSVNNKIIEKLNGCTRAINNKIIDKWTVNFNVCKTHRCI